MGKQIRQKIKSNDYYEKGPNVAIFLDDGKGEYRK